MAGLQSLLVKNIGLICSYGLVDFFSDRAEKSLEKNHLDRDEMTAVVVSALAKFSGEVISLDIKKMKGVWAGFHRIRKGNLRLIVGFNFEARRAFVDVIDWRGKAYR